MWLAVLSSGKTPCILQYPTRKQSVEYWERSIEHVVEVCSIDCIVQSEELGGYSLDVAVPRCSIAPLRSFASLAASDPLLIEEVPHGSILQLSSGTTGHKKGVVFSTEQLQLHADLYGKFLELTESDCVASWLPLYHDMGFIACWVMPLIRRTPIVMMDPITWIEKPERLLEAIVSSRATVCYLPNFAFEVLSRLKGSWDLSCVRHWISCSEPTYATTLERFIERFELRPEAVSTCYGMAENIFAVAQSRGFRTKTRDGKRLVSCGEAIPRTEFREVDGEIYVRSPYSLTSYLSGEAPLDKDGFYRSGDLGFIEDGELVLTGRVGDILNHAGRKFMLNDFDQILNEEFPLSAGRCAALAARDEALGTETPLFLVEHPEFWSQRSTADKLQRLRDRLGFESFELHFVPPSFISKTSSGKINRRKTLSDFRLAHSVCAPSTLTLRERIQQQFPTAPWDRPAAESLDSLARLNVELLVTEAGGRWDPGLTLNEMISSVKSSPGCRIEVPSTDGIIITSLMDANHVLFAQEELFRSLSHALGVPVAFRQVCAPPSPILLSDIIFRDYFLAREPGPQYESWLSSLEKITSASLLMVDDIGEVLWPHVVPSVYPIVSHRFQRNPAADCLAVRWARYTAQHHRLPIDLVDGTSLSYADVNGHLRRLSEYAGLPLFRCHAVESFSAYAEEWEYRHPLPDARLAKEVGIAFESEPLLKNLFHYLATRRDSIPRRPIRGERLVSGADQPHFCSWLVNETVIEHVAENFDRVAICGLPASVPRLARKLTEAKKEFFYSSATLSPQLESYDCIVTTGLWGAIATTKPTVELMSAGREERFYNLRADQKACPVEFRAKYRAPQDQPLRSARIR